VSRTLDWKQGGKRDEKEGQKELAMEVMVERVIDRRRKKKKGWPSTEKKTRRKKKQLRPSFFFSIPGIVQRLQDTCLQRMRERNRDTWYKAQSKRQIRKEQKSTFSLFLLFI
jgi:hypothetical protein